jgi:hypothetical protein
MPAAQQTTDHDIIRRWVEERNGVPATVKSTHKQGETGVLRIDFKGENESDDRNLQRISWDEFFEKFEEAGLAFLYQDKTSSGDPSRFFKLVGRERKRSESSARREGTQREGSPRQQGSARGNRSSSRTSRRAS